MTSQTENPQTDVPETETSVSEAPATETDAGAARESVALPEDGALSDKEKIAQLEALLVQAKNDVLYAKAEVENVRRRLETQAEERGKYAVVNFAKDVLSVADNLRRALDAVPADFRDSSELANTFSVGVEMTERELLGTMERYGIRTVAAQGQRFDPNLHQAMMEMEDASVPAGTVVLVMQTGYQIHDRLLRPALVGVSKGGPKVPQGEQVDTNV